MKMGQCGKISSEVQLHFECRNNTTTAMTCRIELRQTNRFINKVTEKLTIADVHAADARNDRTVDMSVETRKWRTAPYAMEEHNESSKNIDRYATIPPAM